MDAAALFPCSAVSERIAAVILQLCQTVSARARVAAVTQAQLTYIVGRLLGIRKRFRRLVERIRAGHPPRERARKPRAAKPAADPEFSLGFRRRPPGWRRWAVRPDAPVPLWRALRQGKFAWLLPLAPSVIGLRGSAAFHRAELLGLLVEPESQVLLRTSRRVGDSPRPLCWMLGIETAVLYPAPTAAGAEDVAVTPDPSERETSAAAPSAEEPAPDGNDGCVADSPRPIAAGVIEPPAAFPGARNWEDLFATG